MMRAVLVVVVAIASGASALVATAATPCRSAAAAVSSPVVMSLSRRAALAAGALAAMPLGASAKTALEILSDDRAALAKDTEVVKALDDLLKKERKLAFDDEILIGKKMDAFLEALKKDDATGAAALKAEIQALQARYAAEEKEVLALTAEEATESETKAKLVAKVKEDEKAELVEEDKEALKAEILETEAAVSSESAGFLESIFGIFGK